MRSNPCINFLQREKDCGMSNSGKWSPFRKGCPPPPKCSDAGDSVQQEARSAMRQLIRLPTAPMKGTKELSEAVLPPRRYVPCKGSSYFPNTPFFTGQKPCHALRATWHASLVRIRIILTRTNWQEKFLCAKIRDASP